MHKSESILMNEPHKNLCDFEIQIQAKINKNSGVCPSGEPQSKIQESEKRDQY